MRKDKYFNLTSSSLLVKNTFISALAKVFPLFVGLFALPYLIAELGEEYFGFLAIIWLIISYFTMFDLGIGRALIKLISDLIGKNELEQIPIAAWTGILSISCMGLIAGLTLMFGGDFILEKGFGNQKKIVIQALFYTSLAIPFIVSTTGFKVLLMAEQKFVSISIVDSMNSLLNYLLPLGLLYLFQSDFLEIIFALLILKVIVFFVYASIALIVEPSLLKGIFFRIHYLKKMVHFGKWVTISNIIGPLIGQLDRYFIAMLISITAVTFYTTPLEVLSKVLVLPMSFISVLFPAFSTLSSQPFDRREKLFIEAMQNVFIIVFPLFLILSVFSGPLLEFWVGTEFRVNSAFVAKIFCTIFFLRSVALIPSTYLTGMNRPDLPAKFHFFEIILFSLSLYFTTKTGNINYVGFTALVVSLMDTSLLLISSYKLLNLRKNMLHQAIFPLTLGFILLLALIYVENVYHGMIIGSLALTIYLILYFDYLKVMAVKVVKSLFQS